MEIVILGTGCRKCRKLEATVKDVVRDSGRETVVRKETDPLRIADYGALEMPGLVVDGSLRLSGRIPSPEEIRALLESKGDG